jgi:hypothetical protein
VWLLPGTSHAQDTTALKHRADGEASFALAKWQLKSRFDDAQVRGGKRRNEDNERAELLENGLH